MPEVLTQKGPLRNLKKESLPSLKEESVLARVAESVNPARLWQLHMELAQFGGRSDGGVNRQALSEEDISARHYVISKAVEMGFQCSVDAIGNLFIKRPGVNQNLPAVLTGSHLDSQPTGGRFDGAFGVLAGFEVLSALEDAGVRTERSIEVVSWTNEEGSRFAPGVMGSSVFAGELTLKDILPVQDEQGTTVEKALAQTLQAEPNLPTRDLGFPVAGYIEAHIEQGPILYDADVPIGIVSGIQGTRWLEVCVIGAEAHSGTTPMIKRKDALKTASSMIVALQALCCDEDSLSRITVGRLNVEPNSINTVPGKVTFSVDLRYPDLTILNDLELKVKEACRLLAGCCEVNITELVAMDPVDFDPKISALLQQSAQFLNFETQQLISGAFHDARSLSLRCPAAMLFIPCKNGVSHNPAESANATDIAAGTQVLATTLARLAGVISD